MDCGNALQTCVPRPTTKRRLPSTSGCSRIGRRVEGGSRGSDYGEAFAIVKKIRALRLAHKQLGMFGDELAEVRLEWKRKRNFMKLLDVL